MTAQAEITALLARKGWNATRLARLAGVPASTVLRIVHGKVSPLSSTLDRLRQAAKGRA